MSLWQNHEVHSYISIVPRLWCNIIVITKLKVLASAETQKIVSRSQRRVRVERGAKERKAFLTQALDKDQHSHSRSEMLCDAGEGGGGEVR
jgi:hypothetical protein